MVLLLNDEEFIEGCFGALGWIIATIYFKQKYKTTENFIVIGAISWCILWFTRKIGMRVYRKLKERYKNNKKEYGIKIQNITNMNDDTFRLIIAVLLLITIYIGMIYSSPIDDNFPGLSVKTYSLIAGFVMLTILIYI